MFGITEESIMIGRMQTDKIQTIANIDISEENIKDLIVSKEHNLVYLCTENGDVMEI